MSIRACVGCGEPLARKPGESRYNWARRRYCSWQCLCGIARAADRYSELLWLLENGTPLHEAIDRCGVPSATAAWIWAARHGDTRLRQLVAPGYSAEHNARKKARRQRRAAA